MVNLRDYGEIYCITSPSGKHYIGQCSLKDSNGYNNGTQKRWRGHVTEALNYKHKGCWLLNQAIKKYGEDKFIVQSLISCHKNHLNYYEKYFITEFNSLRPNGYNIVFGGSQTKILTNRSFIKKKSDDVPKYIVYYESNGLTGYRVEDPDLKTKAFLSSAYTMEQKLELAKKYLETGKCHDGLLYVKRRHDEDNSLPKYIKRCKDGYRVESPTLRKSFTNTNYTKEENLAMALEYLNTGNFTPPKVWHVRKNEEDAELPKYIMRYRNGIAVQYYYGKGKKIRKTFLSSKMSDEDKIKLAKEYLDKIYSGEITYEDTQKQIQKNKKIKEI